jgi:phosphoglucosamine mutase
VTRKYFGTDGIRGLVGEAPIDPEFVLKLGWAAGTVLANGPGTKILVGKDTRISGYMFESVLEAGITAAGVDCHMLGPMPTPAIAYLTQTLRAQAGIVISASHNPFHDNGIKFFSSKGSKLPDELELEIERIIDTPMTIQPSERLGKAKRITDAAGRYIEFCKSTIPERESLRGMNIVIDCAHGATYHIAPAVFQELGATVTCIGTEPNGTNINAGYGATDTANLTRKVLEIGADLGIAFDGDGDRVMMVDDKGELVNGDALVYIIARSALSGGKISGGVVGTQMSNLGLEIALRDLGIGFARSKVGDRYVLELLKEKGWTIGGESSGHIICLDKTTTGDGIVSALQVVNVMVHSGLSLAELKSGMPVYPQTMINVKLNGSNRTTADICGDIRVLNAIKSVEEKMADSGRVLLRPSGTEPLIRVMVEGEDKDLVQQSCEEIAGIVESCVK